MAKIAIVLPHNFPSFDPQFVMSLLGVVQQFYLWDASIGNKHQLIIIHQRDGWIDRMREMGVANALKFEADFILFLDCDMIFPNTLIEQLMKTMEEHDNIEAITGLYTFKTAPFLPHVYPEYDPVDDKFTVAAGFPLDRLFQVEGAGFGCFMARASLFQRVERPWFDFKYGVYGEDLWFCRKAKPKMVCDPRISCQHLTQIAVDIKSYIGQNKISVMDNKINPDDATLKAVMDFQATLDRKFEKGNI